MVTPVFRTQNIPTLLYKQWHSNANKMDGFETGPAKKYFLTDLQT